MEITDIRIRQIDNDAKMKAVVSATFDNCFVVHDIKVIEGQDKLFIAMPNRKTPDGEFKDIAHPINMEMREKLKNCIIEKYEATNTLNNAVLWKQHRIVYINLKIIYTPANINEKATIYKTLSGFFRFTLL